MVHHFTYNNGKMHAENVAIEEIAKSVGTPFYCYSSATLKRHINVLADAFSGTKCLIAYAVKANSNIAVLKLLADEGAGADIVSKGELLRALKAGIQPEKIVFSGVGKTKDEMRFALETGIKCFNVESEPEFEALAEVAAELNVVAPISFRVNPDVDAGTHEKISTGKAENKFGVPWSTARALYKRAKNMPSVKPVGIDMHIGSQITKPEPFEEAFAKLSGLVEQLRQDGVELDHVDVGGGLGIPYEGESQPTLAPDLYASIVKKHASRLGCEIILEPGRLIAGNAGILVTQIQYIKRTEGKNFAIIDGAMNDLIRPTLYEAHHEILPVNQAQEHDTALTADIVGPVCETGDYLAKDAHLPRAEVNDLIAIMSAGAYGAVMADQYNTRPLVPEILVKDDQFAVIRKRPTYEEMLALESFADWQ